MTLREIVDETEPLSGAVPVYGPPVALVAVPWLLLALMLTGPFALLVTLAVALVVAALLVAAVGALLAAPFVLVRRLLRSPRPRGRVALGPLLRPGRV
ncbi:hypothetical protein [Solirubrobacter soli]|uniref:hypothetical protein n=1 Tax=Solirubrobacter soli TaxID=363832 RepID=UPI0003F8A2B5|nr:hypothetical protein [Solirubrobacter soli]